MKKKTELSFEYNNNKYVISGDSVYVKNSSNNIEKTVSVEIKKGEILLKNKENKPKVLNSKTSLEKVLTGFASIKAVNFDDNTTKSLIEFSSNLAKKHNTTPEGLEFMEVVGKVLTHKKNNYNLILENKKKIDSVYNKLNKSLKLNSVVRKSKINSLQFNFDNVEYQINGNNLYTGKSEKPYVRVSKIENSEGKLTYKNSDSHLEFQLDKEISAGKALAFLGRIDSEFYDNQTAEGLVDYSKDMAYKYNTDSGSLKGVEFITSAEKIIKYKRTNYLLMNKNNIEIKGLSDNLLNTLVTGAIQSGNQSREIERNL